jgi:diguanylate cyclase (GGDEF)-like protein
MVTILTNVGTAVLTTGRPGAELGVAAVLAVFSVVLFRLPVTAAAPLVGLAPLAGTGAIVWLDLMSRDAGVTGQVFFIVPVIWAAAQLRVAGALVVTAATVGGEAAVVFALLPTPQALTEFAYVTVLLGLICGVLVRASAKQERLVTRLSEQASIDPLTGLVTRRVLDSATEGVVAGVGGEASLVVIDLDRFKTINDTHGHLGGDAALAHVAALLSSACREADIVARMGGDELAVLMLDCPRPIAARRAQAFVDLVRDNPLRLPGGVSVPLSISAGLASLDPSATRAEDLYARADSALYEAKRSGRDRLAEAA